jgi:hypothetical protein
MAVAEMVAAVMSPASTAGSWLSFQPLDANCSAMAKFFRNDQLTRMFRSHQGHMQCQTASLLETIFAGLLPEMSGDT